MLGMDIVELKNSWTDLVWAGGVNGIDLLERGTSYQVKAEAQRYIWETKTLEKGCIFVASSSAITPPIPPANFRAMVERVWECKRGSGAPFVLLRKFVDEYGLLKVVPEKIYSGKKCCLIIIKEIMPWP